MLYKVESNRQEYHVMEEDENFLYGKHPSFFYTRLENNFRRVVGRTFRLRLFHGKSLSGQCFPENDLRKNILRKKRERRKIKIRKMFSPFQIRKTFYRKMALFSIDHPKQTPENTKNIFL